MKSIRELREQYQVITENEEKEQRKLNALVRAGLFDAKNIPMLENVLDKSSEKMTISEKNMVIELLDSLINEVVSNDPVYIKINSDVQSLDEEIIAEAVKTPVTVSDVPTIVVLKRKAVRVYPGGQQVGLYYSQQLDKYVTIPFGEAGIAEEFILNEKKDDSEKEDARRDAAEREEARRRRRRYRERESAREIENKPYETLSSSERKFMSPGKVFTRSLANYGQPITALNKAIVASILRRRGTKEALNKLKQKRNSPEYKKKIQDKIEARNQAKIQATVDAATQKAAAAAPKVSPAMAGTMQGKIQGIQKMKTISETKRYKIVRKQQLNEYSAKDAASDAADILVPGVSAYKNFKKGNYGAAALDAAIDVGSLVTAPLTGGASLAGRAALKGALKGGSKVLRRANALSRLNRIRRRRRRGSDIDLDVNTQNQGGGGGGGSQPSKPYKVASTYEKRQYKDPTIVAPSSSRGQGDPYIDPSTARRIQSKLYPVNESVEVNLGGNLFEINSKVADKVVAVYESLNNNNKKKMVKMLMKEETQNKIIDFVTRY